VAGEIEAIRQHLEQVNALRAAREADEGLARRVADIKRHQHMRFGRDYAGLMESPRYDAATRFFLDDLYGPADFADRDTQFGRVVPAMARVLPSEVTHTVAQLAELHALSEVLDQKMAQALPVEAVDDRSYRSAWQMVGRRDQREAQLRLLLAIGTALERHTRSRLLSATLRMMRRPAKAAGLSQLQSFLERGLAAFSAMHGAQEFLETIAANERRVIDEMFASAKMKNPVE
jgi:hypothetical protein